MSDLIQEAQTRFKACEEFEQEARNHFIADYKFGHGDSTNNWQWPGNLLRSREQDQRPALTINKVRQHCLMILNDMRQNKAAIKVSPTGDNATYESAQVFEDVIRHIEYQSHAQAAYDHAADGQVYGGVGFWRVMTDYVSDKSFDQDIFIRRIVDPLTVYLDPDAKEKDGSDARFAFIFEDVPLDVFKKKYPKYADQHPPALNTWGWITKDHVRVAEYYRKTEKKDVLYALDDGTTAKKSGLPPEIIEKFEKDPSVKKRDVLNQDIKWYFIVGNEIAETRDVLGRYIPLVKVVGEETIIEGKLDRAGHVRALKDPQRMYNYWSSAAVEFAALQTKAPYIVALESTEGVENYWASANRVNHAYLPYKAFDDEGRQMPKPERTEGPSIPTAFTEALQGAAQDMQMASGQYEAQMGEPSNEKSGIAVTNRQRKGDNATFHYIDNLSSAIRFTGRILIDLIPLVYDTPRVLKIIAESGDESQIQVDPQAPQPVVNQGATRIFNPNVGRYEVEADVGPGYATKRQEAFAALTQIATQSPEMMAVAGDLIMKAADFPMADELAERLQRMVPQQALGGPSQEVQQLQSQLQHMQQIMTTMTEKLGEHAALKMEREQQKDIDVYKAETERVKALGPIDPGALAPLVHQMVKDALSEHLGTVSQVSQQSFQTN